MENANTNADYIISLKNILISKFYNLDIIKYGDYQLKSGIKTNIYIDFRKLVNYPKLFSYIEKLVDMMYPELFNLENPKLIPIPMGGIPLGNYLAFSKQLPQIMVRDKQKEYGTKNIVEGSHSSTTDQFIIIEDVITSGSSIQETLNNLSRNNINLYYHAILCICNRGNLQTLDNIPIFSIFKLSEIENYITLFNQHPINNNLSFFKLNTNFTNLMYKLALIKKSNIILSCDFMNDKEILEIINKLGTDIIGVKLHLDIIDIYKYDDFILQLKLLQKKYIFIIIEDAKYGDIESIMYEKINHSRLYIKDVADAITIHGLSGLSVLNSHNIELPMIIVAEMSSADNMIDNNYTRKLITNIRNNIRQNKIQKKSTTINDNDNDNNNSCNINIGGIVCQSLIPQIIEPFEFLTMSPGINLDVSGDNANQTYSIPNLKNNRLGLFWIVGRGITKFKDNTIYEKMANYKSKGWKYFIEY